MGLFDKFLSAEKRAELEAEREAAAAERDARMAEEAERHRKEEIARKIRDEERAANSKWDYREIVDEMRGTTMSMAQLTSENSVEMLPPYQGGTQALLAIRLKGNKIEVVVTVTKGQLTAIPGGGYKIAYKVDDRPVCNDFGQKPAEVNHTTMFISNPADFIREIADGDRLVFEANFYKSGAKQFRFLVGGLDRRFIPR